jgi:hypothetical protein
MLNHVPVAGACACAGVGARSSTNDAINVNANDFPVRMEGARIPRQADPFNVARLVPASKSGPS